MYLGYNTNGMAHHDPIDAVRLLADLGYRGVALTLDHGCLNPYRDDFQRQAERIRSVLESYQIRSVIETGARFLLDARHKHEPTLVTADAQQRARRIDFLCRAIDAASLLGSEAVSFWSGVSRSNTDSETIWNWLVDGIQRVAEYAEPRKVTLAFEPEPGMFIDTMSRYQKLLGRVNSSYFQLTLDVGHLHCLGEVPIPEVIRRWAGWLAIVHIEDMRAGVHEHLMFGEGEMDFAPILHTLRDVNYRGGVFVELSRHSHEGPAAARRAFEFLTRLTSWPEH